MNQRSVSTLLRTQTLPWEMSQEEFLSVVHAAATSLDAEERAEALEVFNLAANLAVRTNPRASSPQGIYLAALEAARQMNRPTFELRQAG